MNFPEIDLKNQNVRIILFVLSVLLFFFNNFETKTLVSILVIFVIINQYTTIKENINKNIIQKSGSSQILLNYNNKIENLLKKIKKYKKKSPYNYKEGMYYWTYFMKTIDLLENHELYNYNQYFENAYLYLKKSTNLFQALGVEADERKYIDALKFNDFKNSKDLMEITDVAKELYQEGYSIMYNLSLRLNEKWKKDPHILNKEIVYLHPHPNDNYLTDQYDYYV